MKNIRGSLNLGDEIEATIVKKLHSNSSWWLGYSEQLPTNIALKLTIPKKKEPYIGYKGAFKIIELTKKAIIATNNESFGFKKLSNRIIIKYVNAIDRVEDYLRQNIILNIEEYELYSIFASIGMMYSSTKSIRNPYRFEMYYGLGKPTSAEAINIILIIKELKRAIREKDLIKVNANLQKLSVYNLLERLLYLRNYLLNNYNEIEIPVFGKETKKVQLHQKLNKHTLNEEQKKKLVDATNAHEHTLKILKKYLCNLSYIPEETNFIDCFATLISGDAIFEIKSINDYNELSQTRAAISQVFEYAYRYNKKKATLWIVFSKKPTTEWLIDYLIEMHGINVLWIENEELVGPSLETLTLSCKQLKKKQNMSIRKQKD